MMHAPSRSVAARIASVVASRDSVCSAPIRWLLFAFESACRASIPPRVDLADPAAHSDPTLLLWITTWHSNSTPVLRPTAFSVADLALCCVLLNNDSRFPWCILVPRLEGLRDFHDVPAAHRDTLFAEIETVSVALQQISNADKMNVAALGNMVPQLHVHVIARHTTDVAWPTPVWSVPGPTPVRGPATAADAAAGETRYRRQPRAGIPPAPESSRRHSTEYCTGPGRTRGHRASPIPAAHCASTSRATTSSTTCRAKTCRMDLLTATDHTSYCPFKGTARYWSIGAGARRAENAVWAYDEPYDEALPLRGHAEFYS